MPRTRTPYPADFRDQIVALARTGRSIEDLAREFEPCAATILAGSSRPTVMVAAARTLDERGARRTPPSSPGEPPATPGREISWQRPRPGLLRATRCRLGLRIDDGKPGHVPNQDHEQNPRRIKVRLLCLARPIAVCPIHRRRGSDGPDQGDPCGLPSNLWSAAYPR